MIGQTTTVTPEFTIYLVKECFADDTFEIELDGVWIGTETEIKEAHNMARGAAKAKGYKNAGLTEAFGRNRQFVQGARGGWTRYKGAE